MSPEELLTDLTAEQQEAVTHKEGPLLVVAGAGTGKTRVLTHRLAYLVSSQAARAEEIVALTFTEKAATAMAERVDQLLPLGTNYATISTFHSFTSELLRHHAHLLGIPADFNLLSEEEELVLLRDHLFELPFKQLRPGSNPTKFLTAIIGFFDRLKDEAITPAELAAAAARRQSSADEAERDEGALLSELAEVFAAYDQLVRDQGYLTFGHCITETLRLLREHPSVTRELRQRYRYILVDEYQDTNWAQTELAAKLAGKEGNLMVVGDDDQAIYGWRGSSAANLTDFKRRFPTAKQVVLTNNFRSTQNILDTAYRLIQHNNPDRLEYRHKIDKRLKSTEVGEPPVWQFYDRLSSELAGLTNQVNRWLQEGIAPQEIAVLTRARQHAATIAAALNRAGIPTATVKGPALMEQPVVKGTLALLTCLVNPADNLAVFSALLYPPLSLTPAALNRLVSQRPYREDHYIDYLRTVAESPPEWLAIRERRLLNRFFTIINDLADVTRERPTVAFLKLIHRTRLYERLAKNPTPASEQQLTSLGEIFELMQGYEERHRATTVAGWLSYLEVLTNDFLVTPSLEAEADPFAVRVLTVHSSKGLEFTAVIVAHCVNSRFPSQSHSEPFSLPPELIKESVASGNVHLEEERRLFYVALTRARRHLVLTGAQRYGEGKKTYKPAIFVSEALGEGVLTTALQSVAAREYLQAKLELPEVAAVTAARPAGPLNISYTDLNTFITCPWQYRYSFIIKVKVPPVASMSFGNTVHNTLRAFFDRRRRGEQPDIAQLLDEYWSPGGFESHRQEEEQRRLGRQALQRLTPELAALNPERLEWSFAIPLSSGDRLRGRIDRVDRLTDGRLAIIDYKTGAAKEESEVRRDLQLGLYIWAVEQGLSESVASVTLHYVIAGQKVTVTRDRFNLAATQTAAQKGIAELKQSLATDHWPAKPGERNCRYCHYRKICPFRYTK